MQPFYLVETTTKDGLIHQGIFSKPQKSGKRALLWIHGLTGRFYGDKVMMEEFAEACEGKGWAFASFNTRGHDQITGMHKADPLKPGEYIHMTGGAGVEAFEECVFDIHAAVDFLVSHGFSEVILVGQSTGATKACFSEGTKPHGYVKGLVLIGPISDRLVPADKSVVEKNLQRMKEMVDTGRGDELVNGLLFFPMTPQRYISLFAKETKEDVFDYGDQFPKMAAFHSIAKPMFVIVSEKDENLDRAASDVIKVFDATTGSKQYRSLIFPGANHGLDGQEKEAVRVIVSWVGSI